jgi:hypothetical protein
MRHYEVEPNHVGVTLDRLRVELAVTDVSDRSLGFATLWVEESTLIYWARLLVAEERRQALESQLQKMLF